MDRAVSFDGGRLFGILTESTSATDRPCVLILNAGLIYRVGPARLAVALARSVRQAGFSSFRFDLSGLGDSEPRMPTVGVMDFAIADARAAMDHLHRHFGFRRFVLVGLCSGAVHAHHVATADVRVVGAALLDGYVYLTLRSLFGDARERIRSPRRLARSVCRLAVRLAFGRGHAQIAIGEDHALIPPWPPRARVEADLRVLRDRGMALLYVFSAEWTAYRYAGQMNDAFRRVRYGPRLTEKQVAFAEHLYLDRRARAELLEIIRGWLAAHLGNESKPSAGQPSRKFPQSDGSLPPTRG